MPPTQTDYDVAELSKVVDNLRDRLIVMETMLRQFPVEHRELQDRVAILETGFKSFPTAEQITELKIGINTLTTTITLLNPGKLQEEVVRGVADTVATKKDIEWLVWWQRLAVGASATAIIGEVLHLIGRI